MICQINCYGTLLKILKSVFTDEPHLFTIAQFNGIAVNDPSAFEVLGITKGSKQKKQENYGRR